jgi:hypothetical protein
MRLDTIKKLTADSEIDDRASLIDKKDSKLPEDKRDAKGYNLYDHALIKNLWNIANHLTKKGADTSNALVVVCNTNDETAFAIINYLDAKIINSAIHQSLEEKNSSALNKLAKKPDLIFSTLLEKISPDLLNAWIIKKTHLVNPIQVSNTSHTTTNNFLRVIAKNCSYHNILKVFSMCKPENIVKAAQMNNDSLTIWLNKNKNLCAAEILLLTNKLNHITTIVKGDTSLENLQQFNIAINNILPFNINLKNIYNHDYWIGILTNAIKKHQTSIAQSTIAKELKTKLIQIIISKTNLILEEQNDISANHVKWIDSVLEELDLLDQDDMWLEQPVRRMKDEAYAQIGRVFYEIYLKINSQEQSSPAGISHVEFDNYYKAINTWKKIKNLEHIDAENNLFIAMVFATDPLLKERAIKHALQSAEQGNEQALNFANGIMHNLLTVHISYENLKTMDRLKQQLDFAWILFKEQAELYIPEISTSLKFFKPKPEDIFIDFAELEEFIDDLIPLKILLIGNIPNIPCPSLEQYYSFINGVDDIINLAKQILKIKLSADRQIESKSTVSKTTLPSIPRYSLPIFPQIKSLDDEDQTERKDCQRSKSPAFLKTESFSLSQHQSILFHLTPNSSSSGASPSTTFSASDESNCHQNHLSTMFKIC